MIASGRDVVAGRPVPDVERGLRHAAGLAQVDDFESGGPLGVQRHRGAEKIAGPGWPQAQRPTSAGVVAEVELRGIDGPEVALVVVEVEPQVDGAALAARLK